MDIEELERLARTGDISREATGFRLTAARMSISDGKVSQTDMAKRLNLALTTYHGAENGLSYPSIPVIRYFYRKFRIDFNFILYGDMATMPADVQDRLAAAMLALQSRRDQKSNSG